MPEGRLTADGRSFKLQRHEHGSFVGGCLCDCATSDITVQREETLGPVLCTVGAGPHEQAVGLAADNEYGNGTAVFTRDGDTARLREPGS
jgi:malonate-semialdehyde dehydrogenase (acetylating)/methylmalonate-semialdehyde dehydrogenase